MWSDLEPQAEKEVKEICDESYIKDPVRIVGVTGVNLGLIGGTSGFENLEGRLISREVVNGDVQRRIVLTLCIAVFVRSFCIFSFMEDKHNYFEDWLRVEVKLNVGICHGGMV